MTSFRKYHERVEYIKYLAKHKRTGTASSLAKKFGVSKRTIKRMIKYLKDEGVNIKYDHNFQTYYIE